MLSCQIATNRRYRLRDGGEAQVLVIVKRPDQSLPEATVTWFERPPGEPGRTRTQTSTVAELAARCTADLTGPEPPPEAA